MTTLILIVNVLDQCKQGQCFPEMESQWPREELLKVLSLSGIDATMLPSHYTYNDIIQLFLDHLNVQRPQVYALCTETDLILDSQTVEVRNNLVHFGPYSKIQKLASNDCRHAWTVFSQHTFIRRPFVMPEPAAVTEKQMRILELEKEVNRLKKQAKESESGRMKAQFDEAENLLKTYRAQLKEERRKEMTVREQNMQLVRQAQVLEAQKQELTLQLKEARDKLGKGATTETLQEIATLKQRLADCERRG